MAVASWMLRNRTLRSGRFDRSRKDNDEDAVKVDLSRDVRDNCKELLEGITRGSTEVSEGKRLNYLNAFVKLILHINSNTALTGFSLEEILCCLRVSLVNQSTQVRAGGLRAIRHLLVSEQDVNLLNEMHYPHLIARSLDVVLRNEIERIQALKLIRKILLISATQVDEALARSLVSLANGVSEDKDRMLRACLAALCELAVLNPQLFVRCGGVAAVTRNILDCQMPRIVECLCGVLLQLLNAPCTRMAARVDLHCLAAPYCDFHYRHGWMDKGRDERELRFNCSRLALLSVLRSWPGVLHFCQPSNASGLRAVVDVLYLNQLDVRKAVLDLLYELLGLPQPDWTDEYSVALNAVDPADPQDGWRLGEGFVAAEGRSIMPHLARCTPNLAEIHLAALLYVFLEVGLLDALVEVIVSSDTFISVRATVLLGELLHLVHALLPPECCGASPALPALLAHTTAGRHQALAAVTALHQLHALLKQRPASCSLYLDHVLRRQRQRFTISEGAVRDGLPAAGGEVALRESGVLQSKEGSHAWNWSVIAAIVRSEGEFELRLDDSSHRTFLRRLVSYYAPSSNRYSHLDLSAQSRQSHVQTRVGCDLVRRLLSMAEQPESAKLLLEWFADITNHVEAISAAKSAHDCLFSPQHMTNTLCHTYFLFVGHMSHTARGLSLLQDVGLFERLLALATTTNHACYVRLIVSSFGYTPDGPPRTILARTLTCRQEGSRLYATQFMLVLLRAGLADFDRWAIELLVAQLFDQSKAVSLTALAILHEACERPACLERLVALRPDLTRADLGDRGELLLVRLAGSPRGFRQLRRGAVADDIASWGARGRLAHRYVRLVEAELLDSLTLHQRAEDGRYDRRHSSGGPSGGRVSGGRGGREVFVPPHLYGQLVRHVRGATALAESGALGPLVRRLCEGRCGTEREQLELKAAAWACGHAASSELGCGLLLGGNRCAGDAFAALVGLAERCPVWSIRGTAVYALGLIGGTCRGAGELFSLGWACVRHDRHERWPLVEEEDWLADERSQRRISPETLHRPDIDSGDEVSLHEPDLHQKSHTLPAGNGPHPPPVAPQHQHKRSLSESTAQHQQQHLHANGSRHRNDSCNESTTSGVSSCDSVPQQQSQPTPLPWPGDEPVAVVVPDSRQSPIPSSSSLSTLRTGLEMLRRGCWENEVPAPRRVSMSVHSSSASNNMSVASPDTLVSHRLSHQDLLGYSTLRTLRRVRASSFRSSSLGRHQYQPPSDAIEGALFGCAISSRASGGGDQARHHRQQQQYQEGSDAGRCYMGISLPRQLSRLFPAADPPDPISTAAPGLAPRGGGCLLCPAGGHRMPATDARLRVDILRHVERLSNPVWSKQSKQALLHLKQRHVSVFQDICLYSEVCNMVSSATYRLGSRRFLQELFLDLNFEDFLAEPGHVVRDKTFEPQQLDSLSSDGAIIVAAADTTRNVTEGFMVAAEEETPNAGATSSPPPPLASVREETLEQVTGDDTTSDTKTLIISLSNRQSNIMESLKLTCSENKFPITSRNNETFIVHRPRHDSFILNSMTCDSGTKHLRLHTSSRILSTVSNSERTVGPEVGPTSAAKQDHASQTVQ